MFIIFETERDRAWTGEGQREGDTESETDSRLWAVSTEPNAASNSRPWDHDLSWSRPLNQLSHPGAPDNTYFKDFCTYVHEG